MKVIIAGGRHFADYDLVKETCDYYFSNQQDIEIVSGRCSTGTHTFTTPDGIKVYGIDGLGEKYAQERGYKVSPFPANWNLYGKRAGPIRNREMSVYAECLVAFWDGLSHGTGGMIDIAKTNGLKVRVKIIN